MQVGVASPRTLPRGQKRSLLLAMVFSQKAKIVALGRASPAPAQKERKAAVTSLLLSCDANPACMRNRDVS